MVTGHIVLTTVAALTVTGFAFTSAYNNAGIPRLARAQVAIVATPFLVASAFSGVPEMLVILVMGPIWIVGILHLVGRSHEAVASLVLTRNHNRFLALNDDLTGIANRPATLSTIETLARDAGKGGVDAPYLLYLDLDGFKSVNDSLGHACGDHVLREVVARFVREIGPIGSIGRVGGDEFIVVLPRASKEMAADLAARLTARAREPVDLPDSKVALVGVTIGGAPLGSGGADEALALADERLYAGKRRGGGAICFG